MFIFDLIKLKRLMTVVFTIIVVSLASLVFTENLTIVGVALGLVGICCGIALPGAALTISKTYDADKRASMLIVTDACFSAAGIFCSWLAISLIARNYQVHTKIPWHHDLLYPPALESPEDLHA